VQINVFDRNGGLLFFIIGMGMSYAAARAAAKVGMRARITEDRTLQNKVHLIEAEAV
jgi:hypothetical protein